MQYLLSDSSQSMNTIERKNNTVVFSSLREFYQPVHSTGFAIKYVLEGEELYTLEQQQYRVNKGSYLLCNSTKHGHVTIESHNTVKGICINIAPALMMEAVASLQCPGSCYPDSELALFFTTPYFPESQYDGAKTVLGKTLSEIANDVQEKKLMDHELTIEFFYSLSEKIIADQLPVFKQLQSLPGIKPVTKRELFKRIARGKEMIDSLFYTSLSIDLIAKEACMSEYHFFRLFKKMVGVSPHQYLLLKRLDHGKKLLHLHHSTVKDAALECGFTDIYSFSKAFKKQFGTTPSCIQENSRI